MKNLTASVDSFNKRQGSKPKKQKQKWREIEQLRDKFKLEKELKIFDDSLEYMLDEF